jgi:hypothetical protein
MCENPNERPGVSVTPGGSGDDADDMYADPKAKQGSL